MKSTLVAKKSDKIDSNEKSDLNSQSVINVTNDTIIIIKHGLNKESILNSNCKTQLLLECIRRTCNISENDRIIDLSDINGNLINIREERLKYKYAYEVLKPRQVLVLLEVKYNSADKTSPHYVPLLENKEIVNENFMLKLLPKISKPPAKIVTQKNPPPNTKPSSIGRNNSSLSIDSYTSNRRKSIASIDKKKN